MLGRRERSLVFPAPRGKLDGWDGVNAMNLFETLVHPDREEEFERAEVCRAANILQVGEFQLLQLAYREWFDHDLPAALVDRLFAEYMLRNRVPHWARHYARRILELEARGEIDDLDPAYHRYDNDYYTPVPKGVRKFCVVVLVMAAFFGGSLYFSHLAATSGVSVLPPYFDSEHFGAMRP